jgi:hypothetical protein
LQKEMPLQKERDSLPSAYIWERESIKTCSVVPQQAWSVSRVVKVSSSNWLNVLQAQTRHSFRQEWSAMSLIDTLPKHDLRAGEYF